jgi:hypothetical protein
MDIQQIKSAVNYGLTVHWANPGYVVQVDQHGQWFVTWQKGKTGENSVGLESHFADLSQFYVSYTSLNYYLDDTLCVFDATALNETVITPHRYVKVEAGEGRQWWVAVRSHLPGITLDQDKAGDLALDLIAEKHGLLPPGKTSGTTSVTVI